MWMMNGCDANELNMNDSLNLTKYSPINPNLIQKASCSSSTNYTSMTLPIYSTSNFVGLNNDLANSARDEQNDHQQALMGSSISTSRWNPTAEQLLALEEMYRQGMRTPTGDQIQQIATQLRRFGKIEGKNVFYWFQNHKARDRLKRRRQVETSRKDITLDKKESGLRRAAHELEQTKCFVHPSNCSATHLEFEGLVSMHKSAATAEEESRTYGWSKCDQGREVQQNSNSQVVRKRSMCKAVNLSYFSPAIHPINTIAIASSSTKFLDSNQRQSSSVLLKPKRGNDHTKLEDYEEIRAGQIQTLELFPLCSDVGANNGSKKDKKVPIKAINTNWTPSQFFEFLPLKN